ncbi:hypothetical protein [Roseibium sp. M-1]
MTSDQHHNRGGGGGAVKNVINGQMGFAYLAVARPHFFTENFNSKSLSLDVTRRNAACSAELVLAATSVWAAITTMEKFVFVVK